MEVATYFGNVPGRELQEVYRVFVLSPMDPKLGTKPTETASAEERTEFAERWMMHWLGPKEVLEKHAPGYRFTDRVEEVAIGALGDAIKPHLARLPYTQTGQRKGGKDARLKIVWTPIQGGYFAHEWQAARFLDMAVDELSKFGSAAGGNAFRPFGQQPPVGSDDAFGCYLAGWEFFMVPNVPPNAQIVLAGQFTGEIRDMCKNETVRARASWSVIVVGTVSADGQGLDGDVYVYDVDRGEKSSGVSPFSEGSLPAGLDLHDSAPSESTLDALANGPLGPFPPGLLPR